VTERVEWDRLADFAAGLLDGTPDADEVGRLVVNDPAWAGAHAQLTEADALVRADLTAMGETAVAVPADVVARLDAALSREEPAVRRTTVVSLDARRRRKRWAAVAAVAAGVVALGAFGIPALRSALDGGGVNATYDNSTGGGAAAAPAPAGEGTSAGDLAGSPLAPDGVALAASGTNYAADTLPGLVRQRSAKEALGGAGATKDLSAAVPPELSRLTDPGARQVCLNAVTTAYGGRATSVDYARFEGSPALVIVLVDAAGTPRQAVVTGPACGISNADIRYAVTMR
jgi:hypothetical protein